MSAPVYFYDTELITGLKPKNNLDFPILKSRYIEVEDDGRRLSQRLPFSCAVLPLASADYFMTTAILQTQNGCVPYICLSEGAGYAWKKYGETTDPTEPSTFALSELTDVSISSPQNLQVLRYNSTSLKWENQTYVKSMTQAQYDALPSSKNSDNIIYFITD